MTDKVLLSIEDGVAIATLNDPARANACGIEIAERLREIVSDIEVGKLGVRALILTGNGRFFSAGADLSSLPIEEGKTPDLGEPLERLYNPLLSALRDLSVPLVTAVNGGAAGMGCSFALLGDIIVAAESAYFLQAFRNVGLCPDGGATWMLPRLVGRTRAMELVLFGERLPAATALEWGMINRCVPDSDLMPAAKDLARKLAQGPASLRLTRRLIAHSEDTDWDTQLRAERVAQKEASATPDFREGLAAFTAKRPPSFAGR